MRLGPSIHNASRTTFYVDKSGIMHVLHHVTALSAHHGGCMSWHSSLLIMKVSFERLSEVTMSATAVSVPWCMWHLRRAPLQCQTPGTQPPCIETQACVVPAINVRCISRGAQRGPMQHAHRAVVSEQRFWAQTEGQHVR
jgi:hypothetical protein